MNGLVKVFAYLLFISGIFLFYVIPNNKYSWMQDFDPSITPGSIEDSSQSGVIFTFIFLILVVLTQIIWMVKSNSRKEKGISAVFILTAIVFWVFKFWI